MAVFARIWPVSVRVRGWVSFTTGTVWSAILATAGLLVLNECNKFTTTIECKGVKGVSVTPLNTLVGMTGGEVGYFMKGGRTPPNPPQIQP